MYIRMIFFSVFTRIKAPNILILIKLCSHNFVAVSSIAFYGSSPSPNDRTLIMFIILGTTTRQCHSECLFSRSSRKQKPCPGPAIQWCRRVEFLMHLGFFFLSSYLGWEFTIQTDTIKMQSCLSDRGTVDEEIRYTLAWAPVECAPFRGDI